MILRTAEVDSALTNISLSEYTVCAGINQMFNHTVNNIYGNHIAPKLECMLM